jgi:hypothetical protein
MRDFVNTNSSRMIRYRMRCWLDRVWPSRGESIAAEFLCNTDFLSVVVAPFRVCKFSNEPQIN